MFKQQQIKQEIVDIGKRLYDFRLVAARGGNLSARIKEDLILITASGSCLGQLRNRDILAVRLSAAGEVKGLTTEFPLHSLVYKNFPVQTVIHCHPPLINAYYAVYEELQSLTFENKLFLGKVPQVTQNTPSITEPEKVIQALKSNNIVVIKNHGVVAVAMSLPDAFYLIEELEQAVKMAGFSRLFSTAKPNQFEQELKKDLERAKESYPMFSKQHILAIVELINQDQKFLEQAKQLNLTAQVAIKLDGRDGAVHKFNFEQGKIVKVDYDDNAPFVISGPADAWKLIFLGRLDPFVATTQGKLRLKGELGKLSRWYVPFTRMFSLFREVAVK
jgi:L-fuculose-phosphate aldolase